MKVGFLKILQGRPFGLAFALAAILCVAYAVNNRLGSDLLLQTKYFVIIVAPAIVATVFHIWRKPRQWPYSLRQSGIPLGIFCSALCATEFFGNMNDPDDVMSSIAGSMLGVFYGGAVTALGVVCAKQSQMFVEKKQGKASTKKYGLTALVFCVLIAAAVVSHGALWYFTNKDAWLIFIGLLGLSLAYHGFKPDVEDQLNSIIICMLAVTLVTLCAWLLAANEPEAIGATLGFGMGGLCLTSALLSAIALSTPPDKVTGQIIGRANWHALEIYGLFFLIVLAPPSFIEMITE